MNLRHIERIIRKGGELVIAPDGPRTGTHRGFTVSATDAEGRSMGYGEGLSLAAALKACDHDAADAEKEGLAGFAWNPPKIDLATWANLIGEK